MSDELIEQPLDEATEDPAEETAPEVEEVAEADEEPDSFPRDYVERLRQENGRYRQRAQRGEVYAQRLHTELVKASGRLADPTDLTFDEAHLDDPEAMSAAIDALLEAKPHLASRRPTGEIGQGPATASPAVDLAALLRSRAG